LDSLGRGGFAAKSLVRRGWESLDFLGFSRQNRAFSRTYTGISSQYFSGSSVTFSAASTSTGWRLSTRRLTLSSRRVVDASVDHPLAEHFRDDLANPLGADPLLAGDFVIRPALSQPRENPLSPRRLAQNVELAKPLRLDSLIPRFLVSNLDRLEAMAMLVSSVEEGSLSAAARKLRIPVATLTRNVNDLEALVGTKLLVRSTRKLELTDAGVDYIASAKQILEQVDEQERRAAGEFSAPRGELVITTPVQIARLRVLPVIDQFLALYPEIRIRLIQSDRIVDLIDSHADVAIRVGHLSDSSLVAARLGSLRVVVVASKELLRKHGEPETPEDLRGYPCIVFDSPSLSPWRFRNPDTGLIFTMAEAPRLLVSSPDAAVDAAIDSIGATLVLEHDVDAAIKAGKLNLILQEYEVDPIPVHVIHLSRNVMPIKVRKFVDFAVPKLRKMLAEFGRIRSI
jgi:DNA-binding transcriptional LysR family regulator